MPTAFRFCKLAVQESISTAIGPESEGNVTDTGQPDTTLTAPILSTDSAVWFSAYGFGWGYCAFSLPYGAVCEQLGATNESAKQVLLAFELGKRRILKAVEHKTLPGSGERMMLSAAEL